MADRNLVSIAYRRSKSAAEAVRALLPILVMTGGALSLVCAVVGAPLTVTTFGAALAMTLVGALGGILEAALWAVAADSKRFSALAATRAISTMLFALCLVAAENNVLSIPVAIAVETGVVALAFAVVALPVVSRARPLPVSGKTLLGFWLIKVVSYLNRFVESWWALAALSGVALASFRIGLAPKTLVLMAFTALLQPTLFLVSHKSWKEQQEQLQAEAWASAEAMVFLAAVGGALLALLYWVFPEPLAPYSEALLVSWVVLGVFAGPGCFGMMASSLLTNYGAIRVPLSLTWIGLGVRSLIYALLLATGRLHLAALAVVGEVATAAIQNSFWPAALRAGLWNLRRRDLWRVLGRSCLSLGALAFLLADASRTIGVVALGISQLLIAADAATEARRALQASSRMSRRDNNLSRSSSE